MMLKSAARALLCSVLLVAVLAASCWAAAAIWFDGPDSRLAAGLLAGSFLATTWGAMLALWLQPRSFAIAGILFAGVAIWWLSLEPSNDRAWQPDVALLPSAMIEGDTVTIRNLRNFDYRSENDVTERWEERRYDLSQLVGVDMYLCYWGSPWIAHTIASWEFTEGPHLAVSIETRKEANEAYSAVRGFFRQFELYYVIADERDVVRLRTNYRGDQCYLYQLTTPPELARAVLLDYLGEINRLARAPRWYNAVTHNCTTTIRYHAQHVGAGNPWDWRILANGRIDELGWERGTVVRGGLSFEELRARSYINDRAHAADSAPDFSTRLRMGLPPRHGPGIGS
ncbi:MAG: DUF4105 domain-containing protein [Acidiferrobacterales bacterium]